MNMERAGLIGFGAVVLLLPVLSGCQTVRVLHEPQQVPVYVESYASPALQKRGKNFPCRLNMLNCPDCALVTVATISGTTVPGPSFPIKNILTDEFSAAVKANFKLESDAARAMLELVVEPEKFFVVQDGDNLSVHIVILARLQDPRRTDKPYFIKRYESKGGGFVYEERTVSPCIYETVQKLVREFADDMGRDFSLAATLDALAPDSNT